MTDTPLLAMRGIRKTFPGVTALDQVNLTVRRGDIHAIVGENGAGKSTLMKVLSGVYPHGDYSGDIVFDGAVRQFDGISASEAAGIIIIHQELALVPLLSIAENIFLGNEPGRHGIVDRDQSFVRTRALLAKVGLQESPDTVVGKLGVGKQQLIEIAKALAKEVRLLILDEPTASLNETDSAALLDLLRGLQAQGITAILISHKLNEIASVANAITVLRDGNTVASVDCRAEVVSEDAIIASMVGRAMADRYPPRVQAIGATMFEVRNWRVFHPEQRDREVIKGIDLHVGRGEVVGIAGLMGAGRTELAMSLFGRSYGRRIMGDVRKDGVAIDVSTVQKAIAHGIAYVTEDRKALGLVLGDTIEHNISLANLKGVSHRLVIDTLRETTVARDYRSKLAIRCSSVLQQVLNLSGGNQQKVVLAKWLFSRPDLLILDEPSRGIDVGAKYEIYSLINALAAEGKGILMISSELPELLGMCDRIYVMNEGRWVAQFSRAEATQENIMRAIVKNGETDDA